jgi:hypothetical protein
MYEVEPFNVGIVGGSDEESIQNREDTEFQKLLQEQQGDEDKLEETKSEYNYALTKPFKYMQDNLVAFPKFLKHNPKNDTISLSGRANVREAIQYELIPIDPSVKEIVFDTFQVLSDAEKIRFQEDLKKAVAEGQDDFQLGRIAEKILLKKVVSWEPIFGYGWDDFEFVGQVLRAFIKGDVDMPIKKVERKEYKIETRPLDVDTAQEYLIHLTFKVNN